MAPLTSGMQPEERDRLTRLESKVDFIISHMNELPPSPETLLRMKEITAELREHDKFIENLKLKIGIVGAGFMLFGTAFSYLVKYLFDSVKINW